MRISSFFLVAAFVALSTNAAAIEKRAVSAPVQLCINGISSVGAQTDIVKARTDQYTRSEGYNGALAINTLKLELDKRLNQTIIDCCVASPSTFTAEETDAILSSTGSYTSKFIGIVNSFVAKKPEFDTLPLWNNLIGSGYFKKNWSPQTTILNNCLRTKIPTSPPTYLQTANGYFTQLQDRFNTAIAIYAASSSTTA